MRKRIVGSHRAGQVGESEQGWLDLDEIATVEVTSEDPGYPIESALGAKDGPGWRASEPGVQLIRILFDTPVSVHRMELRFHEAESERTQEFTVRWSSASDGSMKEIVRQQWNFSPTGSTSEIEHYVVDLDAISVLELSIRPDVGRSDAFATLGSWRMG
jgi:hypothetical protein